MIRFCLLLTIGLTLAVWTDAASAQFRGRPDSRDRGSERSFDRRRDDGGDRGRRWSRDRDEGDSDRRRDWGRGRGESGDESRSFGSRRGDGDNESRGFGSRWGDGGGEGRSFGSRRGFGGPSGGFRPDPGAMFDRFDSDGDGELDDEEFERIPGPFRDMLERSGIREGASRDDFTRGFERMREAREGRDSSDGDSGNSRVASREGYTPAERPRVTIDLPDTFRALDLDGDGQIGFYEWRTWDRSRIDEFFFLDTNGDGFLTPKELMAAGLPDSGGRPSDTGFGRPSSDFRPSADTNRSSDSNDEYDDTPEVRQGRRFFEMLDTNRDGRVNPDEWSASRRLKPLFEEAGARLDRDMSEQEFLDIYLETLQ